MADILTAAKISAKDAFTFFNNKNKDMAMARNKLKFTSFGEDDLINNRGFRSYFAKDTRKTMAAGFCTCIVHAIRLLCLCTTAATEPDLQELLNIMVTDTMKTERLWDVDEVMSRLKLERSTITFQSLARSFADLIGQSTYLGELSWRSILSTDQLEQKIKVLYNSNTSNLEKNILFISFSAIPSVKGIELPYLFRVQMESYKEHPDGEIINFADAPDEATDTVTFQTVGMVYSCLGLEGGKPASFAFHFITYSRCYQDGQYQVLKLVPDSENPIHCLHKVSHVNEDPLEPIALQVFQESGHSLVGLILIRNNNQNGARHPLLRPETIQRIPNPTLTSAGSDPCVLTCAELQKLNSNGIWLDDLLVQAIIHIMFRSLLENGRSEMKIILQSSLAYDKDYEKINNGREIYRVKRKASLQKMFSSSQYIFYIVNVDNYHWICLCLSMKWKRIFTLDSQNNDSTCQRKASEVIQVLQEHFDIRDIEWVRLKSPYQRDGTSCGIFTALNSAFLLKSILEGTFTSGGPTDMKKWGNKNFTKEDKLNIRRCAKDVIYGVKDAVSLLEWFN